MFYLNLIKRLHFWLKLTDPSQWMNQTLSLYSMLLQDFALKLQLIDMDAVSCKSVSLTLQKFSSNVVQKCLQNFTEEYRTKIILELPSSPSQFEQLLQDPYANYVIQTSLDVVKIFIVISVLLYHYLQFCRLPNPKLETLVLSIWCISLDDPIWTRWGCKVQGGGNAGNALTCAAHLGLNSRLISKLANDAQGRGIVEELEADGIDTSHLVIKPFEQYSHPCRNVLNMRVDLGIFRASAMDLMLVRCRNGISIILLKSTFLGLGPTLVGFREDTSK
ncbi:hypothetical protein MKW98_023404, partial [Papaver atlanticum]